MPTTQGMVLSHRLTQISYMNKNMIKYMPADQIKICKKDVCVEARGENARIIVAVLSVVALCAAFYYVSKSTRFLQMK
jgi:hypothetical protein